MAEADIEALRATYAEWARGNFNTPEILAEDIVTVWASEFPDVGKHNGLDGLWRSITTVLQSWSRFTMEARGFEADGPQVLVLARVTGTGRGSGIPMSEDYAHLWTFRDGRAVRLEGFWTWEDGRAALERGDGA